MNKTAIFLLGVILFSMASCGVMGYMAYHPEAIQRFDHSDSFSLAAIVGLLLMLAGRG